MFDHRALSDGSLHCTAPQLLVEKNDQGCKTHHSWSQSIQTGFPPSLLRSLSQGYEGTSQYVVGTGSHRSCTLMSACRVGTALHCSEGTHPGTCGRRATHRAVRRLLLCSRHQTLILTPPDTRDRHVVWGHLCGEMHSIALINNRSLSLKPSDAHHQMTSNVFRNIQVQRIAYCSLIPWPLQC